MSDDQIFQFAMAHPVIACVSLAIAMVAFLGYFYLLTRPE